MATPADKDPAIKGILDRLFGRTASIEENRCVLCGGHAVHFTSELSKREYRISGLCQGCQDETFGKD